jgi:hypothetical protein
MDYRDASDSPEAGNVESFDRQALERNIKQAEDARPGTFRYSDASLGGEIRTSADNASGVQSLASAEVLRSDGSSDVVGTARYSVAGGEAKLYGGSVTAANFGVEEALLDEISQQARSQGADRLQVWVPDNDPDAGQHWGSHGFHRASERDPGGQGAYWDKRL